jgi:formylglycine-generating enzyme required for sulfatase activity
VSGSDFTSGTSVGGDFTSEEGAPLPLAGNQGVIEWEKDNSQMALIPAGSFEMGDHLDGMSNAPVHRVELDEFYMDSREVTVGQFREFVNQSGYSYNRWNDVAKYSPGDWYPMVYVNWNDATAYAKWAGKRLPTEAEWEYAARGGLVGKRYPWGDQMDHARVEAWPDGFFGTAPVGSFGANGYGLYDVAGNVWEWCQDWYGENYYSSSPVKNPLGPDTGSMRVLRGGYWDSATNHLRVANRNFYLPNSRRSVYGFRCVSGSP